MFRLTAPHPTVWLVAAGVLLVCAVAYGPSVGFGYVQDARRAVETNPVIARGNVVEIFTSDYWAGADPAARTLYRPVTVLGFALERRLAGAPDSRLSHLINVLLHALTAVVLFVLVRRLAADAVSAAAAALLFAAHPLLLQAVVNVVGRADVQATLFGLGALFCLSLAGVWPGRERPTSSVRRLGAWGAGLLLFLALGSKEVAVAVPALMLALELVFRRPQRAVGGRWWIERAATLAPSALAVLAFLHLRTLAIGEFPGYQPLAAEDNVLVGLGGTSRVATTLAIAARYAGLLLWPFGLSPDYSGTAIARESSLVAALPLAGAAWLLLVLALAALPLLARRRATPTVRALGYGAALVLVPYLVVGNILVLNGAGFAERLLYFPAAGFCALCGLLAGRLAARGRAARIAVAGGVALLLVLGAVGIRSQARMWANDEALWEHALLVTPRSLRANLVRAGRLEAEGKSDEALAAWRRVVEVAPEYGGGWMAQGVLLSRRGELGAAERALRRAIALRPEIGETHFQLGRLLARTGRDEEAERALRRTLLLSPRRVEAAVGLAHLLYRHGRYAEAAHFYRGAVRLGRDDLRDELRAAEVHAARSRTP